MPAPKLLPKFLALVAISLATTYLSKPAHSAETQQKPKVVFMMADDLGWADVGFHGGNVATPNLDKLAREGVELTQHYVAPVCSPTRSALMTGRFWSRFNVTTPQNERALPWNTVTLPRALKTVGYDTCITGKWHLGSKPEWGPNHYGFDHSYGSLAGGVGPWNHMYKKGEFSPTWHRDEKLITEQGHVTDLLAKEAVGWIESRGEAPFFLYVPFTAVHLPIKEPEEYLKRVPDSITGDVPRQYAACVMHLDDAVGRIVAALEKTGKRQQTMVVFTSDNGGIVTENNDTKYPDDSYPQGKLTGNNRPWRGQKGEVYEGGIHVAAIANWPGKLKPGKVDVPWHIADWTPTICSLAGYKPNADLKWDGQNMWPVLSGETSVAPPRPLYMVAPAYRGRALRFGEWKLVVHGDGDKRKTELYDLSKDPSETTDLAGSQPAKLAEMVDKLAEVSKRDRDAVAND